MLRKVILKFNKGIDYIGIKMFPPPFHNNFGLLFRGKTAVCKPVC